MYIFSTLKTKAALSSDILVLSVRSQYSEQKGNRSFQENEEHYTTRTFVVFWVMTLNIGRGVSKA